MAQTLYLAEPGMGISGEDETDANRLLELKAAAGRAVKSGDGKDLAIFTSSQFIETDLDQADPVSNRTTDPEYKTSGAFNGVDIQCTRNFLIGVNAILTHPNDIASTGDITTGTATHTVAIGTIGSGGTASDVTAPDNDINTGTYIAGNKHLLTAGTIRGLVMQTNEGVEPAALNGNLTAATGRESYATAATHNTAMTGLRGFGL